jgi:hypothetical protein
VLAHGKVDQRTVWARVSAGAQAMDKEVAFDFLTKSALKHIFTI